jgi:UDP-galactopyranose mutase
VKRDVLIVGAGFAGLIMAERLSARGKTCVVVDKRKHIGGNAFDCYDEAGVLIHPYGPHLFHTNSEKVMAYLSQFTVWQKAKYTTSSYTRGRLWSFPINLKTYEQLLGRNSTPEEMEQYLSEHRVPIARPQNSEEVILSQVGPELYEMFYYGYTRKMWGCEPRELDASVCQRIPIRTERNALYFNDTFQYMPKHGYTKMFERMLRSPKVELVLEADYRSVPCEYKHMVYTGPVDAFFDYSCGRLPYRALRFSNQIFYGRDFVLPTIAVNYPNDFEYTRCVEIKHATRQKCKNTTVIYEYPEASSEANEPYYPVPSPASRAMYEKYRLLTLIRPDVTFVGRLARYQYLNMDQVVAMALHEAERLVL